MTNPVFKCSKQVWFAMVGFSDTIQKLDPLAQILNGLINHVTDFIFNSEHNCPVFMFWLENCTEITQIRHKSEHSVYFQMTPVFGYPEFG